MDDYLDEEIECLKAQLDVICKNWHRKVGFFPPGHKFIDLGLI